MTATRSTPPDATPGDRPAGPPIWSPLAILLVGTVLIRMFDLDLWLTRKAFEPGRGWRLDDQWFVQLLYDYGNWPAITVASIAGAVWVGSVLFKRFAANRPLAMLVALSMAIGPGLFVNAIFKEYYGRPRPVEVLEFGGTREFAPVWEPHIGQGGKSFPSGHASMGFFWLTFAVFYSERNRRVAVTWLLVALVHGGCMGFSRIAEGGHWLSDILWAAGMVYLTAWFLYRALRLGPAYSPPVPDVRPSPDS